MTHSSQARHSPWLPRLLTMLAAAALVGCGGSGEAPAASTTKTAQTIAQLSTPSDSESVDDFTSASPSFGSEDLPDGVQKNYSTRSLVQPQNTEGRLLASNCFQCHGTLGRGGFDSIRGDEAEEIDEFLTKAANKDIMAAHAQGYTPAQIQKIVAYLQQ